MYGKNAQCVSKSVRNCTIEPTHSSFLLYSFQQEYVSSHMNNFMVFGTVKQSLDDLILIIDMIYMQEWSTITLVNEMP